jgi:hypothetical protein
MTWTVTTDWKNGESFFLNNKKDALYKFCAEFAYLRISVISRLGIRKQNKEILSITKTLPDIKCDRCFDVTCNGKRYAIQEVRGGYSLIGENEKGIVGKPIGIFSNFLWIINSLITEHKEKL